MRSIGFSTGALALGDFRRALSLIQGKCNAVELSALREHELIPLVDALPSLDLAAFRHISVHVPSSMSREFEQIAVAKLEEVARRGWLMIVHPDIITDDARWRDFGDLLCIENMDKRKPIGQTACQLERIFKRFPNASFCLDLGHARQVDPTMTEAFLILHDLSSHMRQLHISEVSSDSRHAELTLEACIAFRKVAEVLPRDIPVIIESRVPRPDIDREIMLVREILDPRNGPASRSHHHLPRPALAF